jgi:hypothetical protein
MSSLLVLNRIYRLGIQPVMLVFSTGFVNYCPSNLLWVTDKLFYLTTFDIAFYQSNLSTYCIL